MVEASISDFDVRVRTCVTGVWGLGVIIVEFGRHLSLLRVLVSNERNQFVFDRSKPRSADDTKKTQSRRPVCVFPSSSVSPSTAKLLYEAQAYRGPETPIRSSLFLQKYALPFILFWILQMPVSIHGSKIVYIFLDPFDGWSASSRFPYDPTATAMTACAQVYWLTPDSCRRRSPARRLAYS